MSPRSYTTSLLTGWHTASSAGVDIGTDFWLWYLAYADDLALLSKDSADAVLDLLNQSASQLGLRINVAKTKTFGVGNLTMDSEAVDKVQSFYLGSTFSGESIYPSLDISSRIGKATALFGRLRQAPWERSDISIETKMRVYRAAVIPTLLYGCETWRTLDSDLRRLEVVQM